MFINTSNSFKNLIFILHSGMSFRSINVSTLQGMLRYPMGYHFCQFVSHLYYFARKLLISAENGLTSVDMKLEHPSVSNIFEHPS